MAVVVVVDFPIRVVVNRYDISNVCFDLGVRGGDLDEFENVADLR